MTDTKQAAPEPALPGTANAALVAAGAALVAAGTALVTAGSPPAPVWTVEALECEDNDPNGPIRWSLAFRSAGGGMRSKFVWFEPHLSSQTDWQALIDGEGAITIDSVNSYRGISVSDGEVEFEVSRMGTGMDATLCVTAPHAAIAAPLAAAIAAAVAKGWEFAD